MAEFAESAPSPKQSSIYSAEFLKAANHYSFAMNHADSKEVIDQIGWRAADELDELLEPEVLNQPVRFRGPGLYVTYNPTDESYHYVPGNMLEMKEGISKGIMPTYCPTDTADWKWDFVHQVDYEGVPQLDEHGTGFVTGVQPQLLHAYVSLYAGEIEPILDLEQLVGNPDPKPVTCQETLKNAMQDLLATAEQFNNDLKHNVFANFSPEEQEEIVNDIISYQEAACDLVERALTIESDAVYSLQLQTATPKIRQYSFADRPFHAICMGIDCFERIKHQYPQVDFKQLDHSGLCLIVNPIDSYEEQGIFDNQSVLIPLAGNDLEYIVGESMRE